MYTYYYYVRLKSHKAFNLKYYFKSNLIECEFVKLLSITSTHPRVACLQRIPRRHQKFIHPYTLHNYTRFVDHIATHSVRQEQAKLEKAKSKSPSIRKATTTSAELRHYSTHTYTKVV